MRSQELDRKGAIVKSVPTYRTPPPNIAVYSGILQGNSLDTVTEPICDVSDGRMSSGDELRDPQLRQGAYL